MKSYIIISLDGPMPSFPEVSVKFTGIYFPDHDLQQAPKVEHVSAINGGYPEIKWSTE